MGVSMNMRLTVLCFVISMPLFGSGPLVNRYIPSFCMMTTDKVATINSRSMIAATLSAGHASKGSPLFNQSQEMYRFDGLMEMGGGYDLHELVASAQEVVSDFVSPFARETGGSALATRQLLFGAQSSVSLYGCEIAARVPLGYGLSCGALMPLWHVEARQRYQFPVAAVDQVITESIPHIEQAHRFRQMVHADLGMVQKDWIVNVVGDLNLWVEHMQKWSRVWLLRAIHLVNRLSVSAPTGAKSDVRYPASFNVGNSGSWGISYTVVPRFEVKEGVWIQMPWTVTGQTSTQQQQRIAVYAEANQFGALIAPIKTTPGVSVSCEPSLTLQHIIDNIHISFGFSWCKHYSDTLVDMRNNPSVESYLTRTTIPEASFGATARYNDAQRMLAAQRKMKKSYTGWNRMYLLFGVQYELSDLFSRMKYAPVFNVGINYCISNSHAAKLHQVTAGLSWLF